MVFQSNALADPPFSFMRPGVSLLQSPVRISDCSIPVPKAGKPNLKLGSFCWHNLREASAPGSFSHVAFVRGTLRLRVSLGNLRDRLSHTHPSQDELHGCDARTKSTTAAALPLLELAQLKVPLFWEPFSLPS